jgi:hypothetical protein
VTAGEQAVRLGHSQREVLFAGTAVGTQTLLIRRRGIALLNAQLTEEQQRLDSLGRGLHGPQQRFFGIGDLS